MDALETKSAGAAVQAAPAQAGGMAGQLLSVGAPVVLDVVAKKWPKSLTIVSALVGVASAGVAAFQTYAAKDMAGFGASIAGIFACLGAIVGRAKADLPVKL